MNRLLSAGLAGLVVLALAGPGRGQSFLGKPLDVWRNDLKSPQAKVRRSGAFAVGKMGATALSAVGDLVWLLEHDPDATVRDMAACSLGDIARAVRARDDRHVSEPLLKAASDPDGRVRRSAIYALGSFPRPPAGAVAVYREALSDKDATVRQNAAWALGQAGPDAAAQAVPELCKCLTDKEALVRRDAAGALGAFGRAAKSAAEPLMTLVASEPDEVVRKTALGSLAQLAGEEHRNMARSLDGLLKDKDPEVALGAALVLARIGGREAAGALPVLRTALKDPDAHNQEVAAAALASLGPPAAPAVDDLAEALSNAPDPTVRRNVAIALGHIAMPDRPGGQRNGARVKSAMPALVGALKPSEPVEVRQAVAEALAHIYYPDNQSAVPAMLEAIDKDTDPMVRQRCIWAMFGMATRGAGANDLRRFNAVPVLEKVLDETAPETNLVRYDAARLLAACLQEKAPDKTLDVLLDMLTNKDLRVFNRTDANVEGAGSEAMRSSANVQANLGGDARYMAVEALSYTGAKIKRNDKVIEALKEAAREDDPALKQLSDEAKKVLKNQGIK
jgi:HEAT repeat protein